MSFKPKCVLTNVTSLLNYFQLRIRDLEKQLEEKHHEQLKQAQEELHGKYRTEIDALKSELREKHGEEMHKAMSEFQTEQETYFNERLHQLETEHQLEVERLRQEYEMVLTNSKQECDELKVAKFKEKQDLSNQIKSNELEINRLEEIYKTALAKKEEDFKKRMEVVKGSIEKEKELWKFENQEDIQEVVRKFERTLMQKECELEERVQELRSKYETEILKKDMDHIKEIEDVKLELEKR